VNLEGRPVSQAKALRLALEGPEIVVAPAAYNALSTLLVARAGLKVAVLGGSTVCNTLLGLPDAGFLTLTEMEFILARSAAVSPIPIVVDIDNGYGSAINVQHTVRVLERAGAAGVLLEDQGALKRSGHVSGKTVISAPEMVGKVNAAVEARADPDFVVIARTDARGVEGLDSAIERSNEYIAAGADGFFADGLLSAEEVQRVAAEVEAPYPVINLGGAADKATTPKLPLEELREMGYVCVLLGVDLVRAEALAVFSFLEDVRKRGTAAAADLRANLAGTPLENWYRFTGFDEIRAMEERFLPDRETRNRYETSEAGLYTPLASGTEDRVDE
jgi:2-methylisocitrate lyase-like PEP mutase family enzyme